MALIDSVRLACDRLAPRGWGAVLRRHGLDMTRPALEAELARELPIDRSIRGFEDFCLSGVRGIQPGQPAASLLYHAFASPEVHPTAGGEPSPDSGDYPTLDELDAVENFIYGLAPFDRAGHGGPLIVAVFAYQYRPAASTAHGYHADLVFSRAGVARVGTQSASWDGARRGFRSDAPGEAGIAVTPARYAAFLAEAKRPQSGDAIMGRRDQDDRRRTFLFPLQKLFAGRDCVRGATIALAFKEYHCNDKLRRLHTVGRVKVAPGFDVGKSPFVRESGDLVALRSAGASVLVVPRHRDTLVRTVEQMNRRSRKREVVRFVVPRRRTDQNRFATSLLIPSDGDVRHAPEYVNIRHPVRRAATGELQVTDMQSMPERAFRKKLADGQYEAAHYTDDTCDGAIAAVVTGLPGVENRVAYSLVTAPDFFPLADQLEVTSWVRRNFQNLQEHFRQGAPWPLCEGRQPANLELPRPDAPRRKAFERSDETVPAIVGTPPLSRRTHAPDRKKRFASYLPDAASNFFEPGWDVSLAGDDAGTYFAAYGLGSPFPEDAKLCAALNSFWPAVAPDASRTFRVDWSPTAIPLLDGELGHHPDHPRVRAGAVVSRRGWDGEYGPFFEQVDGVEHVNYASLDRSDYVSNALRGDIDVRLTSWIDSEELIRRMDALRRCIGALPPSADRVATTKLWLVSAEAVAAWEREPGWADGALRGAGFAFSFVGVGENSDVEGGDVTRRRIAVQRRFDCQIADGALRLRENGGAWERG